MELGSTFQAAWAAVRNIVVGANLTSLSLIGRPRRLVTYVGESLFLFQALNSRRGLVQKNVFEILPTGEIERIRLGSLNTGEAWFWSTPSYTADIISLSLICQILKPRTVFEIGTLKGYTAYQFALNTLDDAEIFTLDLPPDGSVPVLKTTMVDDRHIRVHADAKRYCFTDSPIASKVVCLLGDSATFDFTPYHGRIDFFFIDGAHSYDYVRSDTLNALKCGHPGSVIAWHDFGRVGVNGVTRWLREFSRDREIYAIPGGSLAFMIVK